MDTITGRRPFLVALLGSPRPSDRLALCAGAAALAALVAADALVGPASALTGIYVIAPFISATFGAVGVTLALDVVVMALGVASGNWHMNFGEAGYWLRIGGLGIGCCFALVGARALNRSRLDGLRLRVLNEIGAIADGSLPLD